MTGTFARHLGNRSGYSLIELLVAVAIFGVLAALGLPHLDTRRQDIQSATKQVIADYRWTRTRAITSGAHFAIEWTSTNSYEVQRMKEVPGGWAVDTVVKEVTLPSHINTSWFWPAQQEFNTRGMMITTTYPLWQLIWDSDYFGWHMISVWPSGQIYEEY
jgi:prepilin-type N-terminal cleavage/methylation domain-containing protein